MQAQGQRRGKPLFHRNHTKDNIKFPHVSNGDGGVAAEKFLEENTRDLATLERIAYCALLKWQKKRLHASFVAWSCADRDIFSVEGRPEME